MLKILGYMALLLGALIALSGFLQEELSPTRPRQYALALHYAAGGLLLLALNVVLFVIPDWIQLRRSPTHQRRKQMMRAPPTPLAPSAPSTLIRRDPRNGGVLVLTLVLLGLLTVLLVQAQAMARGRLRTEQAAADSAALRRAAGEAVQAALQRLADDEDLQVDTTNESWAVREEITTPLGIGVITRVRDEASRFDLNNLAVPEQGGIRSATDVVMDLLTLCGDFTPVEKVTALRDYLDADAAGLHEAGFYAERTPPELCPNRSLYGWGELLHVAGWSRGDFVRKPRTGSLRTFDADLIDCLTLIPLPRDRPLPINVNTASRETLTGVLGLGQDTLVATLVTLRSLKPIRDLEALAVMAEPGVYEAVKPYLAVRSSLFEIEARAFGSGRSEQVRALASRGQDGRVDVLQWLF